MSAAYWLILHHLGDMFLTLTLPLPQFLDLYTSPLHIAVPGGKGMRVSEYFKHGELDESLVSVEGAECMEPGPWEHQTESTGRSLGNAHRRLMSVTCSKDLTPRDTDWVHPPHLVPRWRGRWGARLAVLGMASARGLHLYFRNAFKEVLIAKLKSQHRRIDLWTRQKNAHISEALKGPLCKMQTLQSSPSSTDHDG